MHTSPLLRFQTQSLRVTWYHQWHPSLDAMLLELPATSGYPAEIFRVLCENTPTGSKKKIALVTASGSPLALVGLRQSGWHWEPVTQWLVPGMLFPTSTHDILSVLKALGQDIEVGWWRMDTPPPSSVDIRNLESTPTYRMKLADDYEAYWRHSGHMKAVRQARNRCCDFSFTVDSDGATEWTLRNWARQWSLDPASLHDRLAVASFLQQHGKHHSLLLSDGEKPVAGATLTVHNNDLVAGVIYRAPEYEWHGVGVRLIDASFSWASAAGYEDMDLGGGHDYKAKWAPQDGERWLFRWCPTHLHYLKRVVRSVRNITKRR
jgi:GNAT superfamily N-acetyltransferase